MPWRRIDREGELWGRQRRERFTPAPLENSCLIYWNPEHLEFTMFPPREVKRLRAYSRGRRRRFGEVIKRAAKAGFPVLFRGDRESFTKWPKFDKIILTLDSLIKEVRPIAIWCQKYEQRISPALCAGRIIKWPEKLSADRKRRLEAARKEVHRLKKIKPDDRDADYHTYWRAAQREYKELLPYDPYPHCRRCQLGEEIRSKTCLGWKFEPTSPVCQNCSLVMDCTSLMRLRLAEVYLREQTDEGGKLAPMPARPRRKRKGRGKREQQEDDSMAKKRTGKKSKKQDVTEAKLVKNPKAKKERKGKKASTPTGKAVKSAAKDSTLSQKQIKDLINQLEAARESKDAAAARKIRATLRRHGVYVSQLA